MMTFAVFGAGFLMRPIGAVARCFISIKSAAAQGWIVTLSIMAAGTFLIVLDPLTKASVLAPLLVLCGRQLRLLGGRGAEWRVRLSG